MTSLISEPTASIRSMDELLSIAMSLERESAQRYSDLAQRMRMAGRTELAEVFHRLVREETAHMEMVVDWSRRVIGQAPNVLPAEVVPPDVFDDENIGLISPELLDVYRSFAIAVRNEERAFVFWSYVAAQAETAEIQNAAEAMAREELEHAKTLRRERRKAFFHGRQRKPAVQESYDLSRLEMEVSKRLNERADTHDTENRYRDLAAEARSVSLDLASNPLNRTASAEPLPRSLDALCELLSDHYIDAGEQLESQASWDRAQRLATMAVRRLAIVRSLDAE